MNLVTVTIQSGPKKGQTNPSNFVSGSSSESSTGRTLSHTLTSTFEVEHKDIILMQNDSLETFPDSVDRRRKESLLLMQDIDKRTGYVKSDRRRGSADSGKGKVC